MTDWDALYFAHVEALAALAPAISTEQATTIVPATPDWTVPGS